MNIRSSYCLRVNIGASPTARLDPHRPEQDRPPTAAKVRSRNHRRPSSPLHASRRRTSGRVDPRPSSFSTRLQVQIANRCYGFATCSARGKARTDLNTRVVTVRLSLEKSDFLPFDRWSVMGWNGSLCTRSNCAVCGFSLKRLPRADCCHLIPTGAEADSPGLFGGSER